MEEIKEKDFKNILKQGGSQKLDSKTFNFQTNINKGNAELIFRKCTFSENVVFCPKQNKFSENIIFEGCTFKKEIQCDDTSFSKKFIMHNCTVNNASFKNTSFNGLADFWRTTFKKDITFYKTDFNETVVFSMARFKGNVLFTYVLFYGKSIFGKTKFEKGVDLSQTIISGDLQPFELDFDFKKFETKYVSTDDEEYQRCIDEEHKIPLVNKVRTFQVLKKAFEDISNHPESIEMFREENKALKELVKKKLKDKNLLKKILDGDRLILCLNRISNNYRSDFTYGILFTLMVAAVFSFLTLVFTEEFCHHHFCLCCKFDEEYFIKGVKFFFNFLNPVRKTTYLDNFHLKFYGISYLFDFLGRIAVGYGFYQTVQAFRKFK